MNKLIKFLKEVSLLYDIINTILGIALIILLILVFRDPSNRYVLFATFMTGGLINVINGIKYMKDPKRKNMGMSSILFGVIIVVLGYAIIAIKLIN